jgi:CBS domain-containing protein
MQRKIIPDIVDGQTIHKLPPTASVRDAARMMQANNVAAVVVTEGARLVGIVTERDITCRVVARGLDPDKALLSQVMTRNPDTLSPDDTALSALQLMRIRNFRHLPVVDDDRVVGMVSVRDLYAAVQVEMEEDLREREAFIFGDRYGA